jgi:hypothetical protein
LTKEQLRRWLDTVANPPVHATTQRVVNEAFAEEKPALKPLLRIPRASWIGCRKPANHESPRMQPRFAGPGDDPQANPDHPEPIPQGLIRILENGSSDAGKAKSGLRRVSSALAVLWHCRERHLTSKSLRGQRAPLASGGEHDMRNRRLHPGTSVRIGRL